MGAGAERHELLDRLAWAAVTAVGVRPHLREDCYQQAYLSMSSAAASADRQGQRPSGRYLYLTGRTAVYRLSIAECRPTDVLPDVADEYDHVEATDDQDWYDRGHDWLVRHLPLLTETQREVVEMHCRGLSYADIAGLLGISKVAVYRTHSRAVKRLQEMRGDHADDQV